jgi:hypothetical protein
LSVLAWIWPSALNTVRSNPYLQIWNESICESYVSSGLPNDTPPKYSIKANMLLR